MGEHEDVIRGVVEAVRERAVGGVVDVERRDVAWGDSGGLGDGLVARVGYVDQLLYDEFEHRWGIDVDCRWGEPIVSVGPEGLSGEPHPMVCFRERDPVGAVGAFLEEWRAGKWEFVTGERQGKTRRVLLLRAGAVWWDWDEGIGRRARWSRLSGAGVGSPWRRDIERLWSDRSWKGYRAAGVSGGCLRRLRTLEIHEERVLHPLVRRAYHGLLVDVLAGRIGDLALGVSFVGANTYTFDVRSADNVIADLQCGEGPLESVRLNLSNWHGGEWVAVSAARGMRTKRRRYKHEMWRMCDDVEHEAWRRVVVEKARETWDCTVAGQRVPKEGRV